MTAKRGAGEGRYREDDNGGEYGVVGRDMDETDENNSWIKQQHKESVP